MSKSAKKRKQAARRQMKAARKATKAALYKSYSDQGINNKTRRHKAKSTEPSGRKGQHAMEYCGNAGCKRCSSRTAQTTQNKPNILMTLAGEKMVVGIGSKVEISGHTGKVVSIGVSRDGKDKLLPIVKVAINKGPTVEFPGPIIENALDTAA